MSHNFRENNAVYQGFILSQVILEIPCFEAYKSACKIRRENINYRDFEFIYMQFAGGHTELDVVVPEWTENDQTLLKMPPLVMEAIFSNFDVKTRFVLRKVSKTFEQVVDNTTHFCKELEIHLCTDYFELGFDDTYLIKYNFNSHEVSLEQDEVAITEHSCQNPFEAAMTDLKIIIKNLTIDQLGFLIMAGDEETEQLMRTLQQVHQDNGRDFRVTVLQAIIEVDMHQFLPLLETMDPSFLKEVAVSGDVLSETIFPGIYETNQWSNLKKLEIGLFVEFDQVERMAELNYFEVVTSITVEQAQQLIQTLSTSNTFAKCKLTSYNSITIAELARALDVTLENDGIEEFSHRIKLGNNGGALLINAKTEVLSYDRNQFQLFLCVEREA
ncbi:hypothetical protein CAEBREN_21489 [Caenorhabditis brenneri]|uniref:F-box domain-containing protein n=1 Tax=Caenorhabditis brenneri TaxID=135651 RepID=G0NGK4_CAEBE|nr:hypothetical protein CAEBREN_21489 [Caenorhabditis brenneri]